MGERIQAAVVVEGEVRHSHCASDDVEAMKKLARELKSKHEAPAFIEKLVNPLIEKMQQKILVTTVDKLLPNPQRLEIVFI